MAASCRDWKAPHHRGQRCLIMSIQARKSHSAEAASGGAGGATAHLWWLDQVGLGIQILAPRMYRAMNSAMSRQEPDQAHSTLSLRPLALLGLQWQDVQLQQALVRAACHDEDGWEYVLQEVLGTVCASPASATFLSGGLTRAFLMGAPVPERDCTAATRPSWMAAASSPYARRTDRSLKAFRPPMGRYSMKLLPATRDSASRTTSSTTGWPLSSLYAPCREPHQHFIQHAVSGTFLSSALSGSALVGPR